MVTEKTELTVTTVRAIEITDYKCLRKVCLRVS